MTDPTELEWHAPGEGHWLRSAGHYARPLPILMTEWHDESMERGFGRGFSLVGAPLRTMSSEAVNGWPYSRLVPLLGQPGQPVSNLRVRLEFALRPSLRRRRRTARQVFHERPWIDQATMWDRTGKARGKATHARLAAVDLERALRLQPQSLCQRQRIVVAIPNEDGLFRQSSRHLVGGLRLMGNGDGW